MLCFDNNNKEEQKWLFIHVLLKMNKIYIQFYYVEYFMASHIRR